jgi:hypothetical protein
MTNETRWELPPIEIFASKKEYIENSMVNWKITTDISTGKNYYYNELTGESSWTDPCIDSKGFSTPTRSNTTTILWNRHVDENTGNFYYYNILTKESTWEYPKQVEENQSVECWMQCVDNSTNETYFENIVTKVTQWEYPIKNNEFNNDDGNNKI